MKSGDAFPIFCIILDISAAARILKDDGSIHRKPHMQLYYFDVRILIVEFSTIQAILLRCTRIRRRSQHYGLNIATIESNIFNLCGSD
jgi:hypothetical protein